MRFTPAGRHIALRVEQTDTEVRLTIADSGVGIAPQNQKKVFDEFTQVGDRTARQAGTGLGLALTRRLVQAHGGHIELRSEPGAGSQFTVCLPRRPDAGQSRTEPVGAPTAVHRGADH